MNWKTALKAALSILILYLVIRAVDLNLLLRVMGHANPLWLLWAIGWFVLSKVIGAYRYNALLRLDQIHLDNRTQLRLYWLGMYYNLLLPGGISGDGYKIKLLMDAFGRSFKRLFSITLFDRVSGVLALGQLCLLLALGLPELQVWWWLWLLGFLVSIPVSKILFDRMIRAATGAWIRTSVQSMGVQVTQAIATFGIICALQQQDHWLGYSIVFLVSSVVAMLPLTIGGAGARELTFLWGAQLLHLDPERSVAIAFIFYLVSTAVALYGIVYSFKNRLLPEDSPEF
ncbi:MAG: flippase-like domain-containing protein [Bacteroidetes bacterium]|nr:MAG: flippase-like domain-containing protein [Bacteroidota bacterium]